MEGDDGARTGIPLLLAQDLTAIELGVIVACDKVPHDDTVTLTKRTVLTQTHESVGRTEEIGAEVAVGLVDIGNVPISMLPESLEVIKSVIAYAVASLDNHLVLVGVLAHIVAHHEEGGFDAVLVQHVEHPRGDLGDGAVVEGEVYGPLRWIHPPACTGIQLADELWGLLNEHRPLPNPSLYGGALQTTPIT